jgi:hypothetical protein
LVYPEPVRLSGNNECGKRGKREKDGDNYGRIKENLFGTSSLEHRRRIRSPKGASETCIASLQKDKEPEEYGQNNLYPGQYLSKEFHYGYCSKFARKRQEHFEK